MPLGAEPRPGNAFQLDPEPIPWVLRVTDGRAERVDVTLGLRDPRTEQVLVTAGVSNGDTLLRGAAQGIALGTAVELSGH